MIFSWKNAIAPRSRGFAAAVLCLAVTAVGVAGFRTTHAQGSGYDEARRQFIHAYALVGLGPTDVSVTDSEALRTYPLYPYLEAARIRATLQKGEAVVEAEIAAEAFLERYGNEPVTRDLRRDLLTELAGRKQWSTFLKNYRDDNADATVRCLGLTARIEVQPTASLNDAIVQQWLSGKDTPAECEPAFAWLKARNGLTSELIEKRARLALENGNNALARQLAAQLPAAISAPLLEWVALIEQPQAAITKLIAAPDTPVEPAALLDGWTRLARKDADAAMLRLDALVHAKDLDREQAGRLVRELALALSWNRRPEAVDYFDRIAPAAMDERSAEWHARAALWASDWPRVARVIAAMPEGLRKQTRWRYWAARAQEQLGDKTAAQRLYLDLDPDDNFYSALGAARSNRQLLPHAQALSEEAAQLDRLAQLPALIRAHELWLCSLQPLAALEWAFVYGTLAPSAQQQAVRLAANWGWYDQAVTSASRQSIFNDYVLLYPRPYDREVKNGSALTGLPGELIYAVLRQESLYRADAVSSADALGLLQLRLATARNVAKDIGYAPPARATLFDPTINIPLGAAELRRMVDRFEGRVPVALAAYNAGPAAVARWLPPTTMDADIWIENIPYNETRAYVQRVLWHSLVFAWLDTHKPQDATKWLVKIEPAKNN